MTRHTNQPIALVPPSSITLNQSAQPVALKDIPSSETQDLINAMLAIAQGEQGDAKHKTMVGLAAPQVGVGKRIIVIDTTSMGMGEAPTLKAYINPVITKRSKDTEPGREGCYSTGNVCGNVERSSKITIKAYDRHGNPVTETWLGLTARIFQHEIDHLDGVRFPDRISDDTKLHWVEADQFGDYRLHWANWNVLCPRSKWDAIKIGMMSTEGNHRKVILIGGAPLTGKSTLAANISKKLHIPWVSTDDIRKWMQQLVRKEDYQDLFYSDGMDAAKFYETYKTAPEVLAMENRQGKDVQKGLTAMIDSFWWWNEFIIEGIAITPEYVKQLQATHKDIAIKPIFLVDTDKENIKQRLDKRGLWDKAGTYPDHVKPIELEWTTLFNEYYEKEAKKHSFEFHDIAELHTLEGKFEGCPVEDSRRERLYTFSPIRTKEDLIAAIHFTHYACYQICKQSFGEYFPNAGNIGIFTHYDEEYEQLKPLWKELTKPSDDPKRKYFELHEPIVVPAKDDIPEIAYTHLYIRRPDIYRHQVGDVDFYVEQETFDKLKQSLIEGKTIPGARIFDRPDLDMIELYDPDIDALGYVSTDAMTKTVRTKQSEVTKL